MVLVNSILKSQKGSFQGSTMLNKGKLCSMGKGESTYGHEVQPIFLWGKMIAFIFLLYCYHWLGLKHLAETPMLEPIVLVLVSNDSQQGQEVSFKNMAAWRKYRNTPDTRSHCSPPGFEFKIPAWEPGAVLTAQQLSRVLHGSVWLEWRSQMCE